MAMIGGAAALGLPAFALAPARRRTASPTDLHTHDWHWLVGNWDVWHRRLKERLAGSNEWEEFAGKSALWLTLGGFGTVDDNSLELPGDAYRGTHSPRVRSGRAARWSIWWLDGRNPTQNRSAGARRLRGSTRHLHRPRRIQRPPDHDALPLAATSMGRARSGNRRSPPTKARAGKSTGSITSPAPRRRRRRLPTLTECDRAISISSWAAGDVRHRRLRHRLVGSDEWDEFGGTLVNWPVLGGQGNVGDNVMEFPTGNGRGVGLRAPGSGDAAMVELVARRPHAGRDRAAGTRWLRRWHRHLRRRRHP